MPVFSTDADMVQMAAPNGSFGYSATKITKLGATEYTLCDIEVDRSGSVAGFQSELEVMLKAVIRACKLNPRADNLMARVGTFESRTEEVHGYKLLSAINEADYDGTIQARGMTVLYDATASAINNQVDYAKQLAAQDFESNGIVFIITDGDDTASTLTKPFVKQSMEKAVQSESLKGLTVIVIGLLRKGQGDYDHIKRGLESFVSDCGLSGFIGLEDVTPSSLAKLAQFISKSISHKSQQLGGQTSAPVSLTI